MTQKLMQAQGSNYSFQGQDVYIGIDVHQKSWSISLITKSGYKEHFSQQASASILYSHLQKRYKGAHYHSVYESGFTGFSTHYSLVSLGIDNIIVNASDVPTTQKERLHKTDKVDAHKLASCLRDGKLTGIYILSKEEICFREEVRYRSVLVKENTRWKNRIKSYLYREGIPYPQRFAHTGSHWSGQFIKWLEELSESFNPGLKNFLSSYLKQRDLLTIANKRLRLLVKEPFYAHKMELLMSIPGVGFYTAITFLSEIGNVDRFKNEREFANFIGIVPTCHDSGDKEKSGSMTFRQNRHLAAVLIEASWSAIRCDITLAACYGQLCRRMENNKAIIRIARKLSNRILTILKTEKRYICGTNHQKGES